MYLRALKEYDEKERKRQLRQGFFDLQIRLYLGQRGEMGKRIALGLKQFQRDYEAHQSMRKIVVEQQIKQWKLQWV